MKENIIQAIVADMQRDLDCRQIARLKAVLHNKLQDVEITETSNSKEQNEKQNKELLDSFLSAKKIEGCSEKTLAYYKHTIERMLKTTAVAVCHVSTSIDLLGHVRIDTTLQYAIVNQNNVKMAHKKYLC